MAHDLRTPLAVVHTTTNMLLNPKVQVQRSTGSRTARTDPAKRGSHGPADRAALGTREACFRGFGCRRRRRNARWRLTPPLLPLITMRSALLSRRFAANYFSTLGFIGLSYWVISSLSGFHRGMLQGQWQFGMFGIDAVLTVHTLFLALIALYAVVLIPYYARYPWLHSKAFVFLQGLRFERAAPVPPAIARRAARCLRSRSGACRCKAALSPAAKQAGLALLLKFFFAPLMINWCLNHVADMVELRDAGHRRNPRGRDGPRAVRQLAVLGLLPAHPVRRHAAVHAGLHHRGAGARQSHPLRGSRPSSAGSSASPVIRPSTTSPAAFSNGRAATSRTSTTPRSTTSRTSRC